MQTVEHQPVVPMNWSDGDDQNHYYTRNQSDDDMDGRDIRRRPPPYDRRKMTAGPQPFQSLGVTTKPFKSKSKIKKEQLIAD